MTAAMKDLSFPTHPGGQANFKTGVESKRPDLLFMSYHLGRDWKRIESTFVSKTSRGDVLPSKSKLFLQLDEAARRVLTNSRGLFNFHRFWCALLIVLLIVFVVVHAIYLSLATCLILSFLFISYSFNVFHMRHHTGGNLFGWKPLDEFLNPILDFVDNSFMVTPHVWINNHQGFHHLYTNHTEKDRDLYFPYSFLRLSETYEWKWFHKFQPIYTPLVLALNLLTFPWENYFVNKSNIAYLFMHLLLLVGLGGLLNGDLLRSLLMYISLELLSSLIIALMFQVSHNSHSTVMKCPITSSDHLITFDEWIEQQVCETISWGGFFPTLFFGGINLQIEHHVAPAFPSLLLYKLQPELRRICREHNISYTDFPSMTQPLKEYYAHLVACSLPPKSE